MTDPEADLVRIINHAVVDCPEVKEAAAKIMNDLGIESFTLQMDFAFGTTRQADDEFLKSIKIQPITQADGYADDSA